MVTHQHTEHGNQQNSTHLNHNILELKNSVYFLLHLPTPVNDFNISFYFKTGPRRPQGNHISPDHPMKSIL